MSRAARQVAAVPIDPALLRIVEAMARAQAERDFRAAPLAPAGPIASG